jgi:hypothetical protein
MIKRNYYVAFKTGQGVNGNMEGMFYVTQVGWLAEFPKVWQVATEKASERCEGQPFVFTAFNRV